MQLAAGAEGLRPLKNVSVGPKVATATRCGLKTKVKETQQYTSYYLVVNVTLYFLIKQVEVKFPAD